MLIPPFPLFFSPFFLSLTSLLQANVAILDPRSLRLSCRLRHVPLTDAVLLAALGAGVSHFLNRGVFPSTCPRCLPATYIGTPETHELCSSLGILLHGWSSWSQHSLLTEEERV
ncbi:hypothetical protein F4775DRAFT_532127 [Biscogniauxia sp. FL1348]|nr:hypothetical protein F4775DRAFT_532127 [Biscogniauxia sp. FL1348]